MLFAICLNWKADAFVICIEHSSLLVCHSTGPCQCPLTVTSPADKIRHDRSVCTTFLFFVTIFTALLEILSRKTGEIFTSGKRSDISTTLSRFWHRTQEDGCFCVAGISHSCIPKVESVPCSLSPPSSAVKPDKPACSTCSSQSCSSRQRLQLEFVNNLLRIGEKLSTLPTKELRSIACFEFLSGVFLDLFR